MSDQTVNFASLPSLLGQTVMLYGRMNYYKGRLARREDGSYEVRMLSHGRFVARIVFKEQNATAYDDGDIFLD